MSKRRYRGFSRSLLARLHKHASHVSSGKRLARRLRFEPLEDRRVLSITVDTLVDENDGVGVGRISLRDAIAASLPGETIEFDSALVSSGPGTILLTNSELMIDKSLKINGPGAGLLTLDARGSDSTPGNVDGLGSRVLRIDRGSGSSNVDVEINGLTLRGGDANGVGGGIWSSENLKLTNSIVSGNSSTGDGGGIFARLRSGGRIEIDSTSISDNKSFNWGGGVYIQAFSGGESATITNSTISNNWAMDTGGLRVASGSMVTRVANSLILGNSTNGNAGGVRQVGGTLFLAESTMSGNSARFGGGGMYVTGGNTFVSNATISGNSAGSRGGGIQLNTNDVAEISQVTISDNSAGLDGGGIYVTAYARAAAIVHSTIAFNTADSDNNGIGTGGGIAVFVGAGNSPAALSHVIVAGNKRGPATSNDIGATISGSVTAHWSIIEVADATINGSNNLVGQDARLAPLAENGGPTRTHALLPSSPAINAGDPGALPKLNGVPEFDQRRETHSRMEIGRVDIGAFEFELPVSHSENLIVDALGDELDFDFGAGQLTLREAIYLANLSADEQTISFAASLTENGPATIHLGGLGDLAIAENVTINGPGAQLLTIIAYDPTPDANNRDGFRAFRMDVADTDVTIQGLTLTGGDPGGSGGAIASGANLTIKDSVITGNFSIGHGGAIYQTYGSLHLFNSTISNNLVQYQNVNRQGGGIFARYADVVITDSTIAENHAVGAGGGVYIKNGDLSVIGSTITGNSGDVAGGGLYIQFGDLEIVDSQLMYNLTKGSGGGAATYIGLNRTAQISNTTISHNTAVRDGGGIYSQMSGLDVANSTISGNSARNGGGIDTEDGRLEIVNSTINGNTAFVSGGGVFSNSDLSGQKTTSISNSTISGNVATLLYGGGVHNAQGLTIIRSSTVTENGVQYRLGGGVASSGDEYTRTEIESSIVAGNTFGDVDYTASTNSFQSNGHNLIGVGNAVEEFVEAGDQSGFGNVLLGPLANNGGPTLTHALLPGSPAIDAGALNSAEGFDQRGAAYARVFDALGSGNSLSDIGAFELQHPDLAGDYNNDDAVDSADYPVWRATNGDAVERFSGADGNGDGVVDELDWQVWRSTFGNLRGTAQAGVLERPAPIGFDKLSRDGVEYAVDFAGHLLWNESGNLFRSSEPNGKGAPYVVTSQVQQFAIGPSGEIISYHSDGTLRTNNNIVGNATKKFLVTHGGVYWLGTKHTPGMIGVIVTPDVFRTISYGGSWNELLHVQGFDLQQGELKVLRTDGTQETTFVATLPPSIMRNNVPGANEPGGSGLGTRITGDTMTEGALNKYYENGGEQQAASTLLDAVGMITYPIDSQHESLGTGTVLSIGGNTWVLTAHHVVRVPVENGWEKTGGVWRPKAGSTPITFKVGSQTRNVTEVRLREHFGNRDLALLKLDSAVNGIIGAQLPDYSIDQVGAGLLLVGYGLGNNNQAKVLRFGINRIDGNVFTAQTPTSPDGNLTYNGPFLEFELSPGEVITAKGDSGGPAIAPMYQWDSGNLLWVPIIAGVTSNGEENVSTFSTLITSDVSSAIRAIIPQPAGPTLKLKTISTIESGDSFGGLGEWDFTVRLNGVPYHFAYDVYHWDFPDNFDNPIGLTFQLGSTSSVHIRFEGVEVDDGWPEWLGGSGADDSLGSWETVKSVTVRNIFGIRREFASGTILGNGLSYKLTFSIG